MDDVTYLRKLVDEAEIQYEDTLHELNKINLFNSNRDLYSFFSKANLKQVDEQEAILLKKRK